MNRMFGRSKPKEPPPDMKEVIKGVSFIVSFTVKFAFMVSFISCAIYRNSVLIIYVS